MTSRPLILLAVAWLLPAAAPVAGSKGPHPQASARLAPAQPAPAQPAPAKAAPGAGHDPAKDKAARELGVALLPAYAEVMRDAYLKPSPAPVKEMAAADATVVQLTDDALLAACAAGHLEKLDWNRLGGRDRYWPQTVSACGAGAAILDEVLAWDRDKFPTTPGWQDFWDVAKYPGKRGLHRGVEGNLELALLADGVAAGDVYPLLRTEAGVDRAFRKLDQLKPYLVWWDNGADAARLLGSGEVLMTSAPNLAILSASARDHRHFGIQWAGSLNQTVSWAITQGAPDRDRAYDFLNWAEKPGQQKRLIAQIPFGAPAHGAEDGLPPEIQALSPTGPDNLKDGLAIDARFWQENLPRLAARFQAWMAH